MITTEKQSMVIQVSGSPKPQPRVRAFRRGNHIRMYTPTSADEWKSAVMCATLDSMKENDWQTIPLRKPVRVSVDYHFPRVSGFRKDAKWKSTKPDIDNCNKLIFDCLVFCYVIADDGQIVDVRARKLINDEWQGAVITVEHILREEKMMEGVG